MRNHLYRYTLYLLKFYMPDAPSGDLGEFQGTKLFLNYNINNIKLGNGIITVGLKKWGTPFLVKTKGNHEPLIPGRTRVKILELDFFIALYRFVTPFLLHSISHCLSCITSILSMTPSFSFSISLCIPLSFLINHTQRKFKLLDNLVKRNTNTSSF